jgi:hypothetical protein
MVFYAIANVLLDLKLSRFNNLTLMVCYAFIVFSVALVGRQVVGMTGTSVAFPTGEAFVAVVFLGLAFAVADYFYVGAYTNGGNILLVTTITVMFPVVASLIKFGLTRTLPNGWHIGGYIAAVGAILLVMKGNE